MFAGTYTYVVTKHSQTYLVSTRTLKGIPSLYFLSEVHICTYSLSVRVDVVHMSNGTEWGVLSDQDLLSKEHCIVCTYIIVLYCKLVCAELLKLVLYMQKYVHAVHTYVHTYTVYVRTVCINTCTYVRTFNFLQRNFNWKLWTSSVCNQFFIYSRRHQWLEYIRCQ